MHLSLAWQFAILIPLNVGSFVISWLLADKPDIAYYWYGAWLLWCVGWAALDLAGGRWAAFAIDLVFGAIFFSAWWNNRKRRKRKRAAELAGYKAKAALEKIAAKQREVAQKRPVLSPIPEQQ